jgi:DNA-directed RNA polymerase subunit E"
LVEKACRDCHFISEQNVCPECKSKDLSDDFSGLAIIINPETSSVAKAMGIKKEGRYAIRIR